MFTKALKRSLLLIAGIISVMVIVLTQSFYKGSVDDLSKKQTKEQQEQTSQSVINAPSDVVPHGNAVVLEDAIVIAPQKNISNAQPKKAAVVLKKVFVTLFKTLFRVTIAPNAP